MGMYTGLKGKVKFSDNEYGRLADIYFTDWESDILGLTDKYDSVWDWMIYNGAGIAPLVIGRTNWIFWYGDTYMPDGWGVPTYYDMETKIITFSSSLKNYQGTIENFIENILPKIADAWDLISLYEEDTIPTEYKHNVEAFT